MTPSPQIGASLWAEMFVTWVNPLMRLATSRDISEDDVFDPHPRDDAEGVATKFEAAIERNRQSRSRWWLAKAVAQCVGFDYYTVGITKFVWCTAVVVQVVFFQKLVEFVAVGGSKATGLGYGLALGSAAFVQATMMNLLMLYSLRCGARVMAGMSVMLYRKSLRLAISSVHQASSASGASDKQTAATGSAVNLSQNDTRRVQEAITFFHFGWSALMEMAVVFGYLVVLMGSAAWLGIGIIFSLIPIQVVFARQMGRYQRGASAKTDERIRTMGELLRGALLVKLNVWESKFLSKVAGIRAGEVRHMQRSEMLNSANLAIFQAAPIMATLGMFAVYTIAQGKTLTAPQAFAALAWVNVIMRTFITLPRCAASMSEGFVACQRMQVFLDLPEQPKTVLKLPKDDGSHAAIEIRGPVSFTWRVGHRPHPQSFGGDSPPVTVLHDVSLSISNGSLTAVAGPIAAGKSSLLSAILGDLGVVPSSVAQPVVTVRGSVAFVPQKPWILNASLKANVLFGCQFDERKFWRVLEACSLTADVEAFPDKELTEIGEGGTTLSGGQQQRVSLARALYRDADVYLMDDVLSALDARVAREVFNNVLSSTGYLHGKTRVLVTHTLWCLPHVEDIVLMSEGRVRARGSFASLQAGGVDFAAMIDGETGDASGSSGNGVETSEVIVDECAEVVPQSDSDATPPSQPPSTSLQQQRGATRRIAPGVSANHSVRQLVSAENKSRQRVSGSTYRAYVSAGGGLTRLTELLLLFSVSQGCRVMCDVWIARWANHGVRNFSDSSYALVYLGLVGTFTLLLFLRNIAFSWSMVRASTALHNNMFDKVLRAPMTFFWSNPSGRVLNRFSKDMDNIDKLMVRAAADWWNFSFIGIGAMVSIMVLLPWLLVILVPLMAVMYMITRYFFRASRQLKRLEAVTRSPVYQHFGDTMAGLASIRAFGATDAQLDLFTRITNKNLSAYFSYFAVSRWLSMRLDCVTATVVLGIGVFAGLFRDSMSAGLLGVALAQGLQMSGLLQFAVRQGAETESYMTSVERIAEYGDLDVETDRVKGVDCQDGVQVDNVVNAVEFRDVVMRYSRDLPAALNGVSFSCKPREKIGIVGRTGGGKSSLGVALFRIVNPERGSVLLDGVDTGCMSLEELRTKVAVIPQSPVLFSGTLRANLDPFDTVSDERIWTALTRVHMAEAVRNMQDGLSSFVAENGENFSVGQRQLLCLARALIREAPVIYMDEATANVDGDTDALIQGTIRSEFAACTVLTVAHRLNTVVDCDRVLVMVSGVVVEFDSPAALLRDDNSHFTGLVNETGARSAAYLREAAFAAEASRNSGGVNGKMALE